MTQSEWVTITIRIQVLDFRSYAVSRTAKLNNTPNSSKTLSGHLPKNLLEDRGKKKTLWGYLSKNPVGTSRSCFTVRIRNPRMTDSGVMVRAIASRHVKYRLLLDVYHRSRFFFFIILDFGWLEPQTDAIVLRNRVQWSAFLNLVPERE